jgi:NAD(P)-dependent dehydrogenase (short-subunit alcohol dehydrogenase family)
VVTGAASGIGRSLAGRLTVEGMHVVLADVEEGALRDAVAGIGADAVAFTTDVTSMESVEALAEFAYDTFGAVHVLCNNAGVFQGGLLWECSDADFEWTLGVNVMGIVHGVRAFVPRMLAAGTEGHVINTVSMAGLATTPFSGPYDVSKFAAMAATECLAHDLASLGAPIAVSAVCPGLVDTGISRSRRNRPSDLDRPQSEGAAFVELALADGTAGSMSPSAVADLVLEAIREERFLVPTRPSYARQLAERSDDLVARKLPRSPMFD